MLPSALEDCPCGALPTAHLLVETEMDGRTIEVGVCPVDGALSALANSGITNRASGANPRATTKAPVGQKELTMQEIQDQLSAIETKLDQILQKLASGGGAARKSYSGGGAGGAKKDRSAGLSNIQTRHFAIEKVYKDAVGKGTAYKLQTAGGPKISTFDANEGRLAERVAGTGEEIAITFGTNARGYFDAVSIVEASDTDFGN